MKWSGMTGNLFRTILWSFQSVTSSSLEGFSKGLKCFFSRPLFFDSPDLDLGLGLFAREGEKRSWNYSKSVKVGAGELEAVQESHSN